MKLSELIVLAQLKLERHGDLDVLTSDFYPAGPLLHYISEGEFPPHWDMPEGFEYVRISGGG